MNENRDNTQSQSEAEIFSRVSILGEEIKRNCADTKPKNLSREAQGSKPKKQNEKKNSKGVKASGTEIKVNAGNIDEGHNVNKKRKDPNPFSNRIPEQEFKENREAYEKAASENAKISSDPKKENSSERKGSSAGENNAKKSKGPGGYKGSPNSAQSELNAMLGITEPSIQTGSNKDSDNTPDPFDERQEDKSAGARNSNDRAHSDSSVQTRPEAASLNNDNVSSDDAWNESRTELDKTLKATQLQHDRILDELDNMLDIPQKVGEADSDPEKSSLGEPPQKPHFRKLGRKISADEAMAIKEDGERGPRATLIIHTKTVDVNGNPVSRRDSMSYHKSGDLFPHAHITNVASGDVYEIDKKYCSIGKSSTMECVVNERFISREHAIIVRSDDGAYYINDTNSKNGTFVNETRVFPGFPCRLRDGDKLRLANIQFVFEEYTV